MCPTPPVGVNQRRPPALLRSAACQLAAIKRIVGRHDEALEDAREGAAICIEHGFTGRLGTILIQQSYVLCDLGEIDRGIADFRRGLELWKKTGGFHLAQFLSEHLEHLLEAGRRDEADAALVDAECYCDTVADMSYLGEVVRQRGRILAMDGLTEEAAERIRRALDWARERNAKLFELRAARDLAEFRRGTSGEGDARATLAAVVARFPAELDGFDLRRARALR